MTSQTPLVLTIAGFDPSGGAGIIADVKTIVHCGCRPAAAITSLTFQNAAGVYGATHETAKSLRAQVVPVIKEQQLAAVKIGMLPTAELVWEASALVAENHLPGPIIDPVLKSTSGYELIEPEAIEVWLRELMPLARLITPNIPEAESLTGIKIFDERGMHEAAAKLRQMGARAVLIKGGHASWEPGEGNGEQGQKQAADILDDAGEVTSFRGDWITAPLVRGTGCMLSSAIAAGLAHGADLKTSISDAKKYVAAEISKFKTEN